MSDRAELLSRTLEDTFRAIERERMADVPILNPAIKVQAVGFQEWEGQLLGILITPWFMNLMLLPLDESEPAAASGESSPVDFPAGRFEFIHGEEAAIGAYQMCSLYSPVFDFEDHAAAVATAEAVLEQLFEDDEAEAEMQPPAEPPKPVSRRALLRGLSDAEEARV